MRTRIFIDTETGREDKGLITDIDIPVQELQEIIFDGEQYIVDQIRFKMDADGKNISVEKQIILLRGVEEYD